MKFTMAAAAMLAAAGAAFGAPQETFNQDAQITGTFASVGLQGNGGNGMATFTATGGYTLRQIRLSGTLTSGGGASWPKEASIRVTPPNGGQQFVMQPFIQGASFTTAPVSVDAAYFAVPLDAASPTGVWTLEFFETFDDAATDATWSNLQIVFDDAAPTLPTPPSGTVASATFTDVPSNGTSATSTETRTLTYAGVGPVDAIHISGLAEAVNGRVTSGSASLISEMRVGVTPPGGAEFVVVPFTDPRFSPSAASIQVALPATVPGTGTWTVRFFESVESHPGTDNWWDTVTFSLVDVGPPAVVATLNPETDPGNFVTTTVPVVSGQVTWVAINLPSGVSFASQQSLDIDTEGSLLAPANNPNVGLYRPNGTLLTSDADDGSDLQAQLTYGYGIRPRVGNGFDYNGRDGADVPGGTYYLAINGGTGAFGSLFGATNTGANIGTVTVRARYFAANAPLTLPTAQDLGTISESNQPQVTISAMEAGEVRWFRFTVAQEASNTTGFWVDIDTNPPGTTFVDTEIAVYTQAGALVASDDDDGPNPTTTSFAFSALSLGAETPIRVYGGTDWVDGNGRDPDLAPGVYYLAVGRFNLEFFANNFGVNATGPANTEPFNLNIRTNLPGGPTGCNAADIATAGNPDPNAGPDGFLTGDDFDLFISAFFNETRRTSDNSLIADLVDGNGNPPPDGFLTGSDFDYFIAKFFEGC